MKIIEEHRQFTLVDDNGVEKGVVTFSIAGDSLLIIDHTHVDESLTGKGYASKLVEKVVDKARKENKKIIPLCPYARSQFEKKPEYKDVFKQ